MRFFARLILGIVAVAGLLAAILTPLIMWGSHRMRVAIAEYHGRQEPTLEETVVMGIVLTVAICLIPAATALALVIEEHLHESRRLLREMRGLLRDAVRER